MSDIKDQIDSKLANWGVSFSASLVGATKRDGWECDEWRVKFGRYETHYFTGIGHRNEKTRRPVAPRASDVLFALISDAEAADMSFSEWCDNYGYDNDSISAFNTYRECEETGRELRKVFNGSQRAELRELLQDY